MPQGYTSEQIWKLYDNLPEELKEVFFSLETAEVINNTCKKYGITDARVGKISDVVGQVLVGLLLPSEFQKNIQKETAIPEVLVEAIAKEINRFIFYPVKPALEQLHKIGLAPSEKVSEKVTGKIEEKVKIEEKPTTPPGKDTYREPIE